MKRQTLKALLAAGVASIAIGSTAIMASADSHQAYDSWWGNIDFGGSTVSDEIAEEDSDRVSHITWEERECDYDFKLKFYITATTGAPMLKKHYILSNPDLGVEHTVTTNCIKGRTYHLGAARENLFDEHVYVTGIWEP